MSAAMVRVSPSVDSPTALFGLSVHGFENVGRLQRTANQREHAESMQGQRLLEPFVQARNRRLVELVQLSPNLLPCRSSG